MRWTSLVGAIAAIALLAMELSHQPPSELGSPEACKAYGGLPAEWGDNSLAGMVLIQSGSFVPGTQGGYPDELPLDRVDVADFWIDRTEVTRAQFASFVAATGYVTEAEVKGGAALFQPPTGTADSTSPMSWWRYVEGANWRLPNGPDQPAALLDAHPVTLVTLSDAQAYAHWRGNELPSEVEWEYAARAGGDSQRLGDEPVDAQGRPTANYWQGIFPFQDAAEDGFAGLAPSGCFAANGNGLFDMIGNVWEWTADAQLGPILSHANGDPGQLRGASSASGFQVIKGGSWLCATSYCARYRSAARERQEADLATSHVGFRTIRRLTKDLPLERRDSDAS